MMDIPLTAGGALRLTPAGPQEQPDLVLLRDTLDDRPQQALALSFPTEAKALRDHLTALLAIAADEEETT
jgi:hypothetical protein